MTNSAQILSIFLRSQEAGADIIFSTINIITGEVEITSVRVDKPVTELGTRVIRDDGTVVLEGTAVCYTLPIQVSAVPDG